MQELPRNPANESLPRKRFSIEQAARTVAHLIEQKPDGFTYDPRQACLASFPRGSCLVSVGGFEARFLGAPTQAEVQSWVEHAAPVLRTEGTYVGGWFSRGAYCLDVTIAFPGKEITELIGHVNEQDAVFDWESQTEILLRG